MKRWRLFDKLGVLSLIVSVTAFAFPSIVGLLTSRHVVWFGLRYATLVGAFFGILAATWIDIRFHMWLDRIAGPERKGRSNPAKDSSVPDPNDNQSSTI